MNIYLSTQIQYSKNIKEQNCVDWTERLKKYSQLSELIDLVTVFLLFLTYGVLRFLSGIPS